MKASDFGLTTAFGDDKWGWSRNEDGECDGIWRNHVDSREEAIEELKSDCEQDGEPYHGYITQFTEADIPEIDAEKVLEDIGTQLWDMHGEVTSDFPTCTKEQRETLGERLNKVFGEWLTEFNLWPTWGGCGPIIEVGQDIPDTKEPTS